VPAGIETGVELLLQVTRQSIMDTALQRYARGYLVRSRLMRCEERLLLYTYLCRAARAARLIYVYYVRVGSTSASLVFSDVDGAYRCPRAHVLTGDPFRDPA
jgi:hypothetical protein